MVDYLVELVPPHDFIHEIRLAGHEWIAKLCGSFKSHYNFCVYLQMQAASGTGVAHQR
jgi:hypothetical protein